ncbi:MAG: hypothetical protein IJ043_10690 [Clostridia bacterium]|nr:hypothetical protein [Clostridia bacterium]
MPPYEIERKYLIQRPDLLNLSTLCRVKEICQTYLPTAEGSLRVRRTEERGTVSYVETAKRSVSTLRRIEIERELTEEEYERRLAARDPRRQTIRKTRYCLPYGNHIFEIDIYPFWTKQAVMEVELKEENEEFSFPPFIKVIREVSEDPRYSNHAMAREIPPEDE